MQWQIVLNYTVEQQMRTFLIAGGLCAALLATGTLIWRDWSAWPPVALPLNGMIALGIGVALTILLGAGLMALVFYSARHGYDDITDTPKHPRDGESDA